ncbi:transmembrane protein 116 isoform X1 [Gambusia affinis]|uniref:transmembrane protein 116 isoform X1 n=1 Tax=Gambusia affinis TaxID=33528 RepID=UPI000F393079|nr:transmembrane protein 116 isoform X1 [Gambusia affinis]
MNISNSTVDFSGLLGRKQINALSTLYIVLLSLSVTGSFSVLLVSTVRWRHLRGQVHLLVQLSLADLLAASILLYTSVINKVHPFSPVVCSYLLPLSLTFYFISFLLAVVYALKSRNAVQGWRNRAADEEDEHSQCRRKIKAIPLYAFVWLAPLVIYFVYVCTLLIKPATLIPTTSSSQDGLSDNCSTYCNSCILFLHVWKDPCVGVDETHSTFIRVFLAIAVTTAMLSCSVIYWKIGKWHEKYMQVELFPVEGDGHSRRQFKRVFSTARNIVIVILFCWAPALLLLLMSSLIQRNVKQGSLYGLYLIQAATVSLQGFLNSMVYAWRRPNFTDAVLGEFTPLVRYTHRPFFEESLRH